jgi:hypothetical protein
MVFGPTGFMANVEKLKTEGRTGKNLEKRRGWTGEIWISQ